MQAWCGRVIECHRCKSGGPWQRGRQGGEAPDLQRGESRNLWTGMRGWSPGMYREKHTLE